jgi:hypothetical protein
MADTNTAASVEAAALHLERAGARVYASCLRKTRLCDLHRASKAALDYLNGYRDALTSHGHGSLSEFNDRLLALRAAENMLLAIVESTAPALVRGAA